MIARANLITMSLLFLAFALIHSVTASAWFKKRIALLLRSKFAFYRLLYNTLSLLMFAPVFLTKPKHDTALYDVEGWLFVLFVFFRVSAAGLFFWTLKDFDGLEFLGFRQVGRYLRGKYDFRAEARSGEAFKLNTEGMFSVCRHPLYLFAILVLLFETSVSFWYAGFASMLIIYFITGAFFEERRMLSLLGEEYERYRRAVPAFLPYHLLTRKTGSTP